MKIELNIRDSHLLIILLFITAVSAMGLVVAYGGTAPITMGHTWGEMECAGCIITSNLADSSVTSAKIGCDGTLCRGSTGNIGIGSTTPAQKLDVAGNIRATGQINAAVDICTDAGGGRCLSTTPTSTSSSICLSITYRVFDTAGTHTWTKPAGVKKVLVEVVGGGGGGAGGYSGYYTGGGGGGGGYAKGVIDVSSVFSVAVTVGAGGTGCYWYETSNTAGGQSSFGSYVSATGGAAGRIDLTGAAGGIGSGGLINLRGGMGGVSGDCHGGEAGGGFGSGGAKSTAGSLYGGGGGGSDGGNGAKGAPGVVIVWEYY